MCRRFMRWLSYENFVDKEIFVMASEPLSGYSADDFRLSFATTLQSLV